MNNMKKKMVIGSICVALALVLVFGGSYLYQYFLYQDAVNRIVLESPKFSNVENGTYNGEYDAYMVAAEVRVTVEGGRITEIILVKHKTDQGAPAERIIDDVIAMQSLDVDTVTGATNSSKVILKAIQNALESGMKP